MAQVNRPTNVKQKEQDVNQKLQLYGIYSGKLLISADSYVVFWRVAWTSAKTVMSSWLMRTP